MTDHESAPAPLSAGVGSVAALLALNDLAFVQAAYRLVLGREADEVGLAAYVTQVRQGEDKALIVARLAQSDEGQQRRIKLDGLADLLRSHTRLQRPWPTRVLRGVSRALVRPANEPLERTLRALDNRLYRLEVALDNQRTDLAQLKEAIAQVSITLDLIRQRGVPTSHSEKAVQSALETPRVNAPVTRQVPPRLEQVMKGLSRIVSRRQAASL
jgi:hypothetical protein